MYQDTIAAISTPPGQGGIGIIRLSGSDACSITLKLFDKSLNDHQLVYGHIIDPKDRSLVDEVFVSYMAPPRTFTREEIVEINCHGGIVALQRVLELTLKHGARLAEPGEFTLRAFLNGRIDLSQAEAVLEIIQAKTRDGLQLAMQGLQGRLSDQIKTLRADLLPVLAYLTACIDFPDDEVPEQDVCKPVQNALQKLEFLIAGADAGMIYRHGVRTAIIGRPNVGKSSLLNLLLRENRAIVAPIPGTTRDTLEEVVNLGGIPFMLIDTAGINHSHDEVEALGIERSHKAIEQASLVILVVDNSRALNYSDKAISELLDGKTVLVAANKCDLPSKADMSNLNWPIIDTSALTGKGMNQLENQMISTVLGGKATDSNAILVSNIRHKDALQRAAEYLSHALMSLEKSMPDDFITIDLSGALEAMGEITGETVTEELLEIIFSQFCIGK